MCIFYGNFSVVELGTLLCTKSVQFVVYASRMQFHSQAKAHGLSVSFDPSMEERKITEVVIYMKLS